MKPLPSMLGRLVAGTILIGLAGCGPSRSGSLGPAPTAAPSSTVSSSPAPAQSPPSGMPSPSTAPLTAQPPVPSGSITIQVWFTAAGRIVPAYRTRPATLATSRLALTELVGGPSPAEGAAGLGTAVPAGTVFDLAGISGATATVGFPSTFYAGAADLVRLRQAQVVYTLTQFPTVSRVAFRSGSAQSGNAQSGNVQSNAAIGAPLGRADVTDLLPAIVVTSPAIGQRVSSPITVAGTADVFEATVSVRVLDSTGTEIATRFTTATCGTGCRGDYTTSVPYRLAHDQTGTVEVFEVSMKDGSRVHVVDIPVILTASYTE
jgi:hypothetical protein